MYYAQPSLGRQLSVTIGPQYRSSEKFLGHIDSWIPTPESYTPERFGSTYISAATKDSSGHGRSSTQFAAPVTYLRILAPFNFQFLPHESLIPFSNFGIRWILRLGLLITIFACPNLFGNHHHGFRVKTLHFLPKRGLLKYPKRTCGRKLLGVIFAMYTQACP